MKRVVSRDALIVLAIALAARLAVVSWAATRFPPTADGEYYHMLAMRLAAGAGYTWRWPDGAVTAAAHYPVGYPALLAVFYKLLGARASVAMIVGAVIGALGASAAQVLARAWGRGPALAAGLFVALHPALVPYAAALMTEAIAATGLLAAGAIVATTPRDPSARHARVRLALAGLVLGFTTLVRPQCIVLAPLLGFFAPIADGFVRRLRAGALVALVAVAVCLPWTARNCRAMNRCALVSVNGGWNLLIGVQTTSGAWQALDVPQECRTVWDEAGKDECFERAARAAIARDPMGALARVPAKLAVTFDYFGGAPWYLHEANAAAFDEQAKVTLGFADAIASRLLLALGIVAVAVRALRSDAHRTRARAARVAVIVLAIGALAFALSRHAAPGYLGFVALVAAAGPYRREELLLPWSAAVVASVAFTHALFFGAGRYGLVVAPFVAATAATLLVRRRAVASAVAATTISP